jgi:MerR family transcriptional regulator, copper efflux regulator
MNIGDVAEQSGVPPKTIRYYEDIGLITPLRASNGYRSFREADKHKLAFLGRARALGFTIDDCRTLLALYNDEGRESAHVKNVAREHLQAIEDKIAQLQSMRSTLVHLVDCCAGDSLPHCPILEDLSSEPNN